MMIRMIRKLYFIYIDIDMLMNSSVQRIFFANPCNNNAKKNSNGDFFLAADNLASSKKVSKLNVTKF